MNTEADKLPEETNENVETPMTEEKATTDAKLEAASTEKKEETTASPVEGEPVQDPEVVAEIKPEEATEVVAEAKPATTEEVAETPAPASTETKEEKVEKSRPAGPESLDYDNLSPEQLTQAFTKWLNAFDVQQMKVVAEECRTAFYAKLKVIKQEKLAAFIADGGVEMDFVFEIPEKKAFQILWDEYQDRRKKRRDRIEAEMKEGLKTRQAIIEEMKTLTEGEEKLKETFQHFRALQEKWRNAGPVARQHSSELYRSFHFQVEMFYDYVKINDELRDLDFKKNLEQKETLIEKGKALLGYKNVHTAFKELQILHKKWKTEGGPVAKEHRETVWETFSDITNQLHEKRKLVLETEKKQEDEVLAAKKALVEEIKELTKQNPKEHRAWQTLVKQSDAIFDKFKQAGHLSKQNNDLVWAEFKAARAELNHKKNEFYKTHKSELAGNLEKLKTIALEAEASVNNEDLKETANYLKGLQADWKKIYPVPRKDADKYWKRFRAACNAFFDRIEAEKGAADKALVENATKKEAWLLGNKDLKLEGDKKEALAKIAELQKEWNALGQVPRDGFKDLNKNYRAFIDGLFKSLDLDQAAQAEIKISSKVDEMIQANRIDQAERFVDDLKRTWNAEKANLAKLETNLSFFTNASKGKNALLDEAQKKVDKQAKMVAQFELEFKTASKHLRVFKQQQERGEV